MALNLISLEEAARILGVTVDQLNSLREKGELHGYRDGANWKFKRQDIERVASERAPAVDGPSEESIEFLSLPLDIDDDDSSIDAVLLSERELGESEPGTSSTVIGRAGQASPSESDIRLIAADEPSSGSSGSDVKLVPSKDQSGKPGSDVKLVTEAASPPHIDDADSFDFNLGDDDDSELSIDMGEPAAGGSAVDPAGASGILPSASGILKGGPAPAAESPLVKDSGLNLGMPPAGSDLSLGSKIGGSDLSLGSGIGGSTLGLAAGSDLSLGSSIHPGKAGSDLTLPQASKAPQSKGKPGSDLTIKPPAKAGSDLALPGGAEDDGVSLVDSNFDFEDDAASVFDEGDSSIDLDGKRPARGGSSDVTRRAADSGISLASPSDSGLSLEEPLELSGLGEEPFQLTEDPLLGLADDSDSNEVANLKSDDDFLLTPLDEARDADSDDSGSQVIALDTDSSFDAPIGGLLGSDEDALTPAGAAIGAGGLGLGAAAAPTGAPMIAAAGREAQFSILNLISLGACVLFLSLSGMMAYDLMRNIWSWQGASSVTSPLMDFIISLAP